MSYTFNVLREEAAQKDLFKHATHQRVAEGIFDLLQSEQESMTIGIEGGWGSGKSTVVNLFCQKLREKCPTTLVFNFDTWAHEGDPLRRIFLEKFIFAARENTTSPVTEGQAHWFEEIREKITGRKKTVDVKIKNHTTRYAKWLAIASLFIPAGAALLSKVDYSALTLFSSDPYWLFIIAAVFTFAPLISLIIWAVGGCLAVKSGSKILKCFLNEKGKQDFSLISTDSRQSYTQDITEDGERTSVEFEDFFGQISEYLLKQNICDRIVIIIDNLDRIERDEALKMWSTLQTFFQHRSTPNSADSWRNRVWFMVPHDRNGLSAIWQTPTQKSENATNEENDQNDETKTYDQTSQVAHSFLNKCFQIRFEVPQPIISAWHSFFSDQLNEALCGWPADEKIEICKTYQACNSKLRTSPNPREIRNFINQVGIVGMAWGKQMSAESIALYCHLRHKYGEHRLRDKLLENSIPDSIPIRGKRDEIIAELAGLLFGVEKEVGVELLLKVPISEALKSGNSNDIKKLIERFEEAFWIVWEATNEELLPGNRSISSEEFLNFIRAIAPLSNEQKRFGTAITSIESHAQYVSGEWKLNELDYAGPFEALSHSCSVSFLEWLQTAIRFNASHLIDKLAKNDSAVNENAVKQLAHIEKILVDRDLPPLSLAHDKLDLATWERWTKLWKDDTDIPKFIHPPKGLINQISSVILPNPAVVAESIFTSLKSIYKIHPESEEWPGTSIHLQTWLQSTERKSIDAAYELCADLAISTITGNSEPILSSAKHPQFLSHVSCTNLAGSRNYTIPSLILLSLGKDFQVNAYVDTSIKEFWASDEINEHHSKIYEILSAANAVNLLWSLAEDEVNKAALILLHENLDDSRTWSSTSPLSVFNKDKVNDDDMELKKLITNYLSRYQADEILDSIEDVHSHSKALYNLISVDMDESAKLAQSLCDTSRMTKDQWLTSFKNQDELLNIVLRKKFAFEKYKFSEAFCEYVIAVMRGPNPTKNYIWGRLEEFLEHIGDRDKNEKQILDVYFAESSIVLEQDTLSKLSQMKLATYTPSDTAPFTKRICDWIDSDFVDLLEWITQIAKISVNPDESIRGRIIDISKNESHACHRLLGSLSRLFQVELPENKTDDHS